MSVISRIVYGMIRSTNVVHVPLAVLPASIGHRGMEAGLLSLSLSHWQHARGRAQLCLSCNAGALALS